MEIIKASFEDLEEILALQKAAFRLQAVKYNDFNIPPMVQTLEEIREEYDCKLFLKVISPEDQKIIGSARAYEKNGSCFIERVMVHPDRQNKGIGTALMREIEKRFPDARDYRLNTGHKSERNIYLYKKLGYRVFRKKKVTDHIHLLFMKKENR